MEDAEHPQRRKSLMQQQPPRVIGVFGINYMCPQLELPILDHRGQLILAWDLLVVISVIYSTAFLPIYVTFVELRWEGYLIVEAIIDVVLLLDIALRFRTSYSDRGFYVRDPLTIAFTYMRGWLVADVISAMPISLLASTSAPLLRNAPSIAAIEPIQWLRLPVGAARMGRLVRIMRRLMTSSAVRRDDMLSVFMPVGSLMYLFVLVAHYLGLGWYLIAIRPLETDPAFDDARDWIWRDAYKSTYDEAHAAAIRYVCALYWALGVMTNLKGIAAHETRQCVYHDPIVVEPLLERIYVRDPADTNGPLLPLSRPACRRDRAGFHASYGHMGGSGIQPNTHHSRMCMCCYGPCCFSDHTGLYHRRHIFLCNLRQHRSLHPKLVQGRLALPLANGAV